jgi:hypothetical protein
VRKRTGIHIIFTAHRAATREEETLAESLCALRDLLHSCGDGISAGIIDDLGRPWTLTRGAARLGSRQVWCPALAKHDAYITCPVDQDCESWLVETLGDGAIADLIYDRLPI